MRTSLTPFRLFMTADAVGGVFHYALDLIAGLAGHHVHTTLAMLGPPMSQNQRTAAQANGATVIETGLPLDWLAPDAGSVAEAAAEVANLASRYQANVVHLNMPALALASYRVPVAAVVHSCVASWWECVKRTEIPADFCWRTQLLARGLKAASTLVCPSRTFARMVSTIYGCPAVVVHNGRSSAPASGAKLEPVAFTAGRLWDEGKNLTTLDSAAGLMDIPLYAAGPLAGPNAAQVNVRHIKPVGVLSETELRAHLARRPIFVCASLYEPFGLTVLEAAQAGCALVLSDIPTFRELWQGAAVFASAKEPLTFAEIITSVAADPSLRSVLGRRAQARAQIYTVEAMTERMIKIYVALLGFEASRREAGA
jgi:glycogen synthase